MRTVLRELPVPDIGPDDGLLDVEVAGVCGTDWEIYRRRSRGAHLGPLILGHENIGTVAAVGQAAAARWGVEVGDRVAIEEFIPCGTCRLCRSGQYRLCAATDSRGSQPFLRYGSTPVDRAPGLWGGFSRLLYLHPNAVVYRLPDGLDPGLAALFVPLSNGIRWVVHEAGGTIGQSIVVQGPGQHGLGCVIAAKEAGMGPIIVSGLAADAQRLAVATRLGADHVVHADRCDLVARVTELTDGEGAAVVVDTSPGATAPVTAAVAMAAKRGVVILAGSKHGQPIADFPHDMVVRKEVTLRGVRGHDHRSVEPALAILAARHYPFELMTTHRFGLDEVDRALRMVGERTDPDAIHVNVCPTAALLDRRRDASMTRQW